MYEARRQKERVSRRINVGSNMVRQRVNNNSSKMLQRISTTDLSEDLLVKRGSPATYKIGDRFVKRWSNNSSDKSLKMEQWWDKASNDGVRVPNYKRETLTDNHNEFVFWSKQCKGTTFFQNSKQGHNKKLIAWLSENKHGSGYLQRLSGMFRAAKMGDPQGFYEDWQNGAFEFIDIQPMTNNNLMSVYADFIDNRQKEATHS